MKRHRIGTYAGGTAGMLFLSDMLSICEDPTADPVMYAQVGVDLNGTPIEAGWGQTEWSWRVMPQSDFDRLLDLQGNTTGTTMYVRTQKRSGASGIDFANYSAMVGRPAFGSRAELLCYDVRIPITMMLEV